MNYFSSSSPFGKISIHSTFVLLLFLFSNPGFAQIDFSAKQARIDAGTVLSSKAHRILAEHQKASGQSITALVNEMEMNSAFYPNQFIRNAEGDYAYQIQVEDMALLENLEAIGIRTIATSPKHYIIEAYIATSLLTELEFFSGSGLKSVHPIRKPHIDGGSTTNQADTVLEAYRVRLSSDNFDGTGVSIGVLSDSYDALSGAAAGMASGDLPSVTVLQESGSSDEGRAMVELIYDIAPGATYFFATANGGQTNYANNIQDLADNGCSVIVDDVVYLSEPFFQDGILAQKVDEVTNDEDVIYFASAGNRSNESYESTNITFTSDNTTGTIVNAYDFDTGGTTDVLQQFTMEDGDEINLSFQWDDPWFSSVDTDLDIVILENGTNTVLASSVLDNIANDSPIELVSYTNNTGSQQIVNLYIINFTGPDPGRIKYVSFGDILADEFNQFTTTINPHAAAEDGIAVAASPFVSRTIESFSSQGPSIFLFDSDGTPKVSAETRNTPDLTAPDGVNNTFFGTDTSCDPDSDPNFFGTSAAAPNAAAVAVLIRQANPGFSRDDVYNALINTAQGMGNSITLEGAGLINAMRAIYGTTAVVPDLVETFETGSLDSYWETVSDNRGRIIVTDGNSPFGGLYHLTMDTWCGQSSPASLNEAILHINANNVTSLDLSFDQREFGDEDDAMSSTFTGSENSDGVAFSVDGTNWFRLVSLTGANSSSTYSNKSFDLRNFAISNGLTLDDDVQVKFQQSDGFPIDSDGMAFDNVQVTATVLSVENLELSGEINEGKAELIWTTSTERNNAGFEVEHSLDGINFDRIDKVTGAGQSDSPLDYQYTHIGISKGTHYYRIQQQDFDGRIAYSNTIALTMDGNQIEVNVLPNPVLGESFTLQTYLPEGQFEQVQYELFNATGKQVKSWQTNLTEGIHAESINIETLTAGVYILHIRIGAEKITRKLVKQ